MRRYKLSEKRAASPAKRADPTIALNHSSIISCRITLLQLCPDLITHQAVAQEKW